MKNTGGTKIKLPPARALAICVVVSLAFMILAYTGTTSSLSNSNSGTFKYQRIISIKEVKRLI